MNLIDVIVSFRCKMEGVSKHVHTKNGTTFNRRRLLTGLGSICGTNDYPIMLNNSHIAGNIEIGYGCTLLSNDLKTSHQGSI